MISRFTVIVAAAACLITFFVVRRILRDQLKLGPPGLLAAAVAALAFLGLCGSGEGLVGVLLIPYATLALTLLLLFLLLWLFRLASLRPKGRRSQEDVFRQHAKRVCNRSSASAPRSGLSGTQPRPAHPQPPGSSRGGGPRGSTTSAGEASGQAQ